MGLASEYNAVRFCRLYSDFRCICLFYQVKPGQIKTRLVRMHGLPTSPVPVKRTVHSWLLNRVHLTFQGYNGCTKAASNQEIKVQAIEREAAISLDRVFFSAL